MSTSVTWKTGATCLESWCGLTSKRTRRFRSSCSSGAWYDVCAACRQPELGPDARLALRHGADLCQRNLGQHRQLSIERRIDQAHATIVQCFVRDGVGIEAFTRLRPGSQKRFRTRRRRCMALGRVEIATLRRRVVRVAANEHDVLGAQMDRNGHTGGNHAAIAVDQRLGQRKLDSSGSAYSLLEWLLEEEVADLVGRELGHGLDVRLEIIGEPKARTMRMRDERAQKLCR